MAKTTEKRQRVKGITRVILEEAYRRLLHQSHIHLKGAGGERSFALEFRLAEIIVSLEKLMDGAIFFDDHEPFDVDMLLNELQIKIASERGGIDDGN
jgi:hypothetical protein